jgi:gas vesicle protein
MKRYSPTRAFCTALVLAALAACASPPPAEFGTVAQSGAKFSQSVPPLLNTALNDAISANSATLIMQHAEASEEARKTALLEANDAYRERVRIFADVGSHALLLRSYFVAMEALASTTSDSVIGSEASNLVNAMGALSPGIESFEIAGRPISSVVGSVAPLLVADFRSAALEEELRKNGNAVVRAIELQRAFLQAVASDLGSQLAAQQQTQEFRSVVEPYVSSGQLPSDWATLRAAALEQSPSLGPFTAAASAAESLKISFIAAAEGGASESLFAQLQSDVNRLSALVQAVTAGPAAS